MRHQRVRWALGSAAVLGIAAAGCSDSYILLVPEVRALRVTAARSSLRVGDSTAVVGEAYDAGGRIINHRRRAAHFLARDTVVATVVGSGMATVTGRKAGATWIVGESGGKRDSVRLAVTP